MSKNICGIDFGTSNSSIAGFISNKLSLIPLEDMRDTIPSTLFFNVEDGDITYGYQAIEEYLDGCEGRLLRSLKSVLGSNLINERTQVGYKSYSFIEIIDLFIGHIKQEAEHSIQENLDSVVMGRPVFFVDGNPTADQKAEDELKSVLVNQGFRNISFEYEPIAAAKNYEQVIDKEELVLVFDIGGGTSDFTLIRLSPESRGKADRKSDILANMGIHIGGTDIDKNFSLKTIMPNMGYGGNQISGLPIPNYHYNSLSTWHLINNLYTNKSLIDVRSLHAQSASKNLTNRFLQTVVKQRGHELAHNVEKAKILLSEENNTSIDLGFIEEGWRVSITSNQLEASIDRELDKIISVALEAVIKLGGVKVENIDTIFMTGGSTAIPGFEKRIKRAFPLSVIANGNRFSSVVTGLGLTAIERYGQHGQILKPNFPYPEL